MYIHERSILRKKKSYNKQSRCSAREGDSILLCLLVLLVCVMVELYDNLGTMGASIKHHLVEGMRNMWQQLNEFARSHAYAGTEAEDSPPGETNTHARTHTHTHTISVEVPSLVLASLVLASLVLANLKCSYM